MIVFRIWIDDTDRTLSHYPVYIKDHLYNTNPDFDYGDFEMLEYYILQTNVSYNSFAFQYNDPGTFVFADAQDYNREIIVNVMDVGASCPTDQHRIQPSSPSTMVYQGVKAERDVNEAPDWGLIIGLLVFLAACVLMLVIAVIVWRPKDAGFYPMKHWTPWWYRSLGAPPPVPRYLIYDEEHWPGKEGESGSRTLGDGAELGESGDSIAYKGEETLEEFNVRVLYDKLEDQNLHLASQLARHRDDLQRFYDRISDQNDELKKMLNDLDLEKLDEIERQRREAGDGMEGDRLQGSGSGDIINAISANINMGGRQYRFTGGSGREAELMKSLRILLDRLSSGNIQITPEMISRAKGGNVHTPGSYNYQPGKIQVHGQSDLLRRQNAERLQQERDLLAEEEKELDKILQADEEKRRKLVESMGEKLAFKLQGELSDAEAAEIIAAHERNLKEALHKHDVDKERQMAALRKKLAERRKKKDRELRERQAMEAEQAGLPPPITPVDNSVGRVHSQEALLHLLHVQGSAGMAKALTDTQIQRTDDEVKQLSEMLKEQLDTLANQGSLTTEQRDELVHKQVDKEAHIARQIDNKLKKQVAELKSRRNARRKKVLDELRAKQERERAELSTKLLQDGHTEDLEFLLAERDLEHQRALEAKGAELDAEEAELVQKLTDSLTADHVQQVKVAHREILNNLPSVSAYIDPTLHQKIMDKYRKDSEYLAQGLQHQKDKQLHDMEAKLAARRARRLAEEKQKSEEMAAKRFLDEQQRQLARTSSEKIDDEFFRQPEIEHRAKSSEEKALEKEHQRTNKDMRERHADEHQKITSKLDQESRKEEQNDAKDIDNHREQMLREMKNRQEAERRSRPNMSDSEVSALMASHANELELLSEKLENERQRQMMELHDKMAARKKRKMNDLRRKQDAEASREKLTQDKEIEEVRMKYAKQAEKKAMIEGVKENGKEDSDKVIRAVLAERHAQEMRDLDKRFASEKKIMVDDAMLKLNDRYDNLREELQKRHDSELAALKDERLSPEEYQLRRSQLLNRQQLELGQLDRQHSEDQKDIERGALTDWELRFARAKLDTKEKHYKEFADALREFNPKHDGIEQAEAAAKELDQVRKKLDAQRKDMETDIQKEKKAFEHDEKKRIENELVTYNHALDDEMTREKQKHERNVEALNKRKDDMMKDKKDKLKEELDRLKQQGASQEEMDQIMAAHQRDMQNFLNRIEADKIRMQSNLQERLKKKREDKMKAKQSEVQNNVEEARRDMAEKQKSEVDRLKSDEVLTISEAINMDLGLRNPRPMTSAAPFPIDTLPTSSSQPIKPQQAPTTSTPPRDQALPSSYQMTGPLNEAELTAILMASPLYQKLEGMKKIVARGGFGGKGKTPAEGEGYIDPRDVTWTGDGNLEPIDLNKVTTREFVVYKFGCFAADLIATHCYHQPITVLLASKIPPNQHLTHNAYRNSFYYDANNRILYMRAERLDSVGQFILVLVHTLAHIKSGDLHNDSNPEFAQEFYRALSVVCDDLFFARYRRDSVPAKSLSDSSNVDVDQAANALLSAMYGDAETENDKGHLVDKLLDTRVLQDIDDEGVSFTKDRMDERLNKYSRYNTSQKLCGFLGNVEDKVALAKSGGTENNTTEKLESLLGQSTTGNTLLTRQILPKTTAMANMTGHAMFQTFSNVVGDKDKPADNTSGKDKNNHKQLLKEQITELENRVDNLSADFAHQTSAEVEINDSVVDLEKEMVRQRELAGQQKSNTKQQGKQSKNIKSTSKTLTEMKSKLADLKLKKAKTAEALEKASDELEIARTQLGKKDTEGTGKRQ